MIEEPKKKRLSRRTVVISACVALLLIAGAAVAVPLAIGADQDRTSLAQLEDSESELATSKKAYDNAVDAHASALKGASTDAAALEALIAAAPGELLDPTSVLEDATKRLDALKTIANKKYTASVLDFDSADVAEQTIAARAESAAENGFRAVQAAAARAQLEERIAELTRVREDAAKAADAIVIASSKKGATLVYDKAGEGERTALAKALEALKKKLTLSTSTSAVAAYVTAARAAAASHAAAVQAESGIPAPGPGPDGGWVDDSGNWNAGGWVDDSGTWNPGGGGAPSNPGGGGGPSNPGGSGEPPAPECWGNQENACDKTPASFATDGNYVGYSDSCFYYDEHNVGYGGHSTSGGPGGVSWSATVNGPTVTYYICG